MRSGRWFLGVVALLAAARAGADNPAPSPSLVPALPTPPPLVAVNPPVPAPQAARGPEALRLFGRLDDDRSAVYIASGPPDARVTVRCGDSLRTLEIWTYLEHPTLGKNARILFYPESPTGSYRYWTVLEGEPVLLAPSAKATLAALEADPGACADALLVVSAVKDISRRQGDNNGGLAERGALAVPHVLPPGRREAGSAGAPARLEQAAHGEGAQEAHARPAREVPPVPRGRRADHHGGRARHAAQARRGLPARAFHRRLLEAPLAGAGRHPHRVPRHLRDAPAAGQGALPEHQYGHGAHLRRERATGRRP